MTEVARTIYINAPIQDVFDALVDLDKVTGWYHFATPIAVEAKPQGRYDFGDGDVPVIEGMVQEVERPTLLEYEFWFPAQPGQRSIVTWRLEQYGAYTKVEFSHRGPHDLGTGWDQLLSTLKTFVEKGAAPSIV